MKNEISLHMHFGGLLSQAERAAKSAREGTFIQVKS